ncbi:proline and serine-rich protein 3 isoform X1 [Epinephelus fuscoguttatus]|uniref:proline and serine-rich protein 3 isoform X1 n=1 Tax=Epinephelus fuscoguttatus TaxID=293821 RepID=UPI0020D042C7|nr:proline and serine-rich protein 3 isoform X1 [Epinephelus fuscoguttatus]XP_049440563.1 proline and serine-rich protein 3 isoform X1 [Epinephelus fuscoguttatus]
MKSSEPVFTRQNPFQPASRLGRTHYHPSRNQPLSNKKKKTTLSPVRLNKRSNSHTLSPESQQLLEHRDQHFTATDGQPVFTESWPSTDCGSSPISSANSSDMETPKQCAKAGKSTVSSERGVQQESVMAKYVERFRHGRPQSREERQQMPSATGEKQVPFWWMSPPSFPFSSTPTKTTDEDHGPEIFNPAGQRRHDRSLSPCSVLSDTYQGELDDTEILHLQEKASRLLLRGECTLSDGSVPVSSEGLACSDFSSPVSVDEPVRRPLIPSLIKSTAKASSDSVPAVSSQKSAVIPSLVIPARREDDILFQWRLRRKIEQAREWPPSLQNSSLHGPTFSWQAPNLSHPSASGQAYKQHQSTQPPELSHKATHPHITNPQPQTEKGNGSCPPASGPPHFPAFALSGPSGSHPQTVAHVPAHMHLLCDVLPCPIKTNISDSMAESQTKVVRKKTQVPGHSTNTFTDEPVRVPSPPPASSGAIQREQRNHDTRSVRNKTEKAQPRQSEKNEKNTVTSNTKQKTTRYTVNMEHADGPGSTNRRSSHQRVSEKVRPRAEQQQQEGSQGFSRESCTGDNAPPPSPIHTALGQVVSEVLFPTLVSSPAQRTLDSSVSPPCTSPAPPQSSVPPCKAQNSVEVISQLLQEAEDSDEKEFEDDPLLQVLRKQRKWVKEQISQVDSMLNGFLEERQVT